MACGRCYRDMNGDFSAVVVSACIVNGLADLEMVGHTSGGVCLWLVLGVAPPLSSPAYAISGISIWSCRSSEAT